VAVESRIKEFSSNSSFISTPQWSICPPCDNRCYPGLGAKFWTHLNEVQIIESGHPSSHSLFIGTDVARHISVGIFSTMITLLAHSMMMFYLIGKGKAVKDAMAEHGVAGDYYRRIAVARKPVFSIGTLAMGVTMVAAIMGASVDTGVLPPIVHAMIAYGAIACNLAAVKTEIAALLESSRIVDEVNHQIRS